LTKAPVFSGAFFVVRRCDDSPCLPPLIARQFGHNAGGFPESFSVLTQSMASIALKGQIDWLEQGPVTG